ncbi:peroxiredoxin family protein [Rossellomorea aquimaris]|uniref:peroxiredoxin family protein n=1 Tax=Rossellomorea aquimaris TaxID=189382 RepID=UPI000ABB2579|nr:TlpA disulfide reductase family protein [Rossellomorea aquimaris]
MKTFFGIVLVSSLLFTIYVENKSDSTLYSEETFLQNSNQSQSYNQLIDIEEGEVSESTPVDHYPGPNVGDQAIDFKLETLSGNEITLSSLKGKKVILNFWATWCPPCREEMPILEELYKKHKDTVEILAINIDPQYNVKQYTESLSLTFPILLDKDDKINKAYDILSVPTTFIINEKGIITHKQIGALKSFTPLLE